MQLPEACYLIAAQLKVDGNQLIAYANEDMESGWDYNAGRWPIGSLWRVEGQILYAITRMFKPQTVVEIGSFVGCSATHFGMALKANGGGRVYSVDNGAQGGSPGSLVPPDIKPFIEFIRADGVDWLLGKDDGSVGLVFEDADHSDKLTANVAGLCRAKLAPGGIEIIHDAAKDFAYVGNHEKVFSPTGANIRRGLQTAGVPFRSYLVDPSDCGFGIWQQGGDWQGDKSLEVKVSEPIKVIKNFKLEEVSLMPNGSFEVGGTIPKEPEPIAAVEDKVIETPPASDLRIGGDDEPIASEEMIVQKKPEWVTDNPDTDGIWEKTVKKPPIEPAPDDDTVILPPAELPKKRGRKPKAK